MSVPVLAILAVAGFFIMKKMKAAPPPALLPAHPPYPQPAPPASPPSPGNPLAGLDVHSDAFMQETIFRAAGEARAETWKREMLAALDKIGSKPADVPK